MLGWARVPVRLLSSALVTKPIHAPVAVAVADELARPVMYPTCAHKSQHKHARRRPSPCLIADCGVKKRKNPVASR